MKIIIRNTTLINPKQRTDQVSVALENGSIIEISQQKLKADKDSMQIDATGLYLCPGMIDIHFHGALGKDTMDGTPESLQVLSDYCAAHGVTAFYPTTWAATPEDILQAIVNVKTNAARLTAAKALGVHVEGPYINVETRGAQLASMIRNPVEAEYQQWFDSGVVQVITCAPEIEHAEKFICAAINQGIRISIGHSAASYEQVIEACNWGASQATHLFNGMTGLHHRNPGTVGGLLADERIHAQLICDGVHLHPAVIKISINAKTPERVILITDSIRGAGLPDGDYDHKGQKFSVQDGVARTPEGGLSGSTLTLDKALRNVMKFTGRPLEEVIPMATSVPAKEMGLEDHLGWIKEGYVADLVLFNSEMKVEKTLVDGNIVFDRYKNPCEVL